MSDKTLADILHPHYGPCDGFRNGECSECHEQVAAGIAANKSQADQLERYEKFVAKVREAIEDESAVGISGLGDTVDAIDQALAELDKP